MTTTNKINLNNEEINRIKANCELFKNWFAKIGSKKEEPFKYLK